MAHDDETTSTATDTTEVSTSPPLPRLEAGTKLGRYEVCEVIGAGGMGVVYRAHDPELKRVVAIKVVASKGERHQKRLLAEARAMAKLSHPNVVPVFDVGVIEGGVYAVMPHLAGGTLHDWIHARPRPWREVLERFLSAGRGLAAAHAAGLVHRDFKPRNVLLDGDDVLVADFGLVARDAAAPPNAIVGVSTIGGTPGYMAPEQARGDDVDARADQFSFCISVWEGLHGQRPSDAETQTQGIRPSSGIPPVPPERRGSPRWLLEAVSRGFAADRAQRWPSMMALLDGIAARQRLPRRLMVGAGAAGFVAGAAVFAFAFTNGTKRATCADPKPRVAQIWNDGVRARMSNALSEAVPSIGPETFARVEKVIDSYVGTWQASAIATCEATHVRRTQSPAIMDLRQACLDHSLGSLSSFVALYANQPTAMAIVRADEAVSALPDIADCADTKALTAQPLPSSRERRDRIRAVERDLDAATSLRWNGKSKEFLEASRQAVQAAREIDYPPLLARALHGLARAEGDNRTGDEETTLRELASVAANAHDDRLVADAWIGLLNHLSASQGKVAEAASLEPVAIAAVKRAGDHPNSRFELLISVGSRAMTAQEFEKAYASFEEALAIASDARRRASALEFRAKVTFLHKGPPAAKSLAEEALRAQEAALGPKHPHVARVLDVLMQIAVVTGDFDSAVSYAQRAIAIADASFGPDHALTSMSLNVLGYVATMRGDLVEAKRLAESAVRVAENRGLPNELRSAIRNLAFIVSRVDGPAESIPLYERGLELIERSVGRDHATYVEGEVDLAARLVEMSECTRALPHLEHVLRVHTPHAEIGAMARQLLAQCEVDTKGVDHAVKTLEEAIAICDSNPCEPAASIPAKAVLGEMLIDSRKDRARGIALLREAHALFVEKGMPGYAKEVAKTLKKAGARPR